MYMLLQFGMSIALLLPCYGVEWKDDAHGDYEYYDDDDNSTYDIDYFESTNSVARANKGVGMGQLTLVLLLGLAVVHITKWAGSTGGFSISRYKQHTAIFYPQTGGPHSRGPGHGRGDDCFTGKLPVKRHYKKTVVMLVIPNSFGLS